MTWSELLAAGRLHRHSATRSEVTDLLMKAQRALHDSHQSNISVDNRFVIAYHGALAAASAAIAAAGFRAATSGHHQIVFEALPLALDEACDIANYLDACRRRRHQALYGRFGQVSEDELRELLEVLADLIERLKNWLSNEHSGLYLGPEG